ncbi:MgtC/SapB transporter family protein [Thermoclostridium stercorarium subsp. stercorarium DSM 8532]|uniref:MgtC/SapB transporter family protein n=4 Tax=Thermoclostridium stercorarium TaxID=1510 RepID=L7VPQ3_THES1|nr:MgtC/SapB family protein [Thermoclostridium stercorarium]AGC68644.1 MgtC/SapB transporter family protein [Thermoclostridium stercorarium subsp. stercorarium DSM 8532]ANW98986.1 MgtC/SapB transporter family protein [Thermoclostridium stercorarium subsp. thermolacticum DSM 2910]
MKRFRCMKTGAQVVVVTINSLNGEAIEEYSNALFRKWGIGSKKENNGVLILVSVGDRMSRIEVGYGLEGALPDGLTGRIQDNYMIPHFRDGDYGQGIANGFMAVIQQIYKEYDIKYKPPEYGYTVDDYGEESENTSDAILILLFLALIVIDLIFFRGRITKFLLFTASAERSFNFFFLSRKGGKINLHLGVILLRLLTAALLGGIVGLERENKKRAAGLRTHVLVCLGSSLVMVLSEYLFNKYRGLTNVDPARLGAQVISGIGFLGAGTIIKQGISVRGLTTAASLWAVACIGLAAGSGFYTAAVIAAAIVFITLKLLSKFENVLMSKEDASIEICLKIENRPGKLGEVASFMGRMGANINNVDIDEDEEDFMFVRFSLKLPKGLSKSDLIVQLKTLKGVAIME